jgi:hypothetical protein
MAFSGAASEKRTARFSTSASRNFGAGSSPGSAGGDLSLFCTSRLTDKASVRSEVVFEGGNAQSYKVDPRRMLLKYDYDEHLKTSFGRFQTNIE